MKNFCGFRIEVKPKSKLGQRLTNLSVFLRNRSSAKGIVKTKRWCFGGDLGFVEGTWTVRQSGVISFKGTSIKHGMIEFVYGKLTIGDNLDNPGYQEPLPYRKSTQLFLKLIDGMYPHLSKSPIALEPRITSKG